MVEINGLSSGLARVSVVNEHGAVLIDTFCKPPGMVTDYRYEITGISEADLENSIDFEECRKKVNFSLLIYLL